MTRRVAGGAAGRVAGGAAGHPPEAVPDSSGPGTVLLDIGGDIGAAVVYTPPSFAGQEIEIRPDPGEWTGTHVAVIPRLGADRARYAAVFPSLAAGRYLIRCPADPVPRAVDVVGGAVVEQRW